MRAVKDDRAFPIREACRHPAGGVHRRRFDVDPVTLHHELPADRKNPTREMRLRERRQRNVIAIERLLRAVGADPGPCAEIAGRSVC